MARRIVVWCSVGYLVALIAVTAGLRLVGERWWLTAIALYLPRIGWALPLPSLTIALLVTRSYRLLVTQAAAAWVVVVPLMGLCLSGPRTVTPGTPHFRILTLNIGLAPDGVGHVLSVIHGARADVIVLEEVGDNVPALRAGLDGFSFQHLGEFVIASRFPLDEPFDPPAIQVDGRPRSPHYARFRLQTPGGPVRVYATHPTSPRAAFEHLRGEGFRNEILSGRVMRAEARGAVAENARLRVAQVRALVQDAAGSPDPVLIAGDTNLPGLSWALTHWLGDYQDAFAEAGRGFGYTYPAHKWTWMRIDRILGDSRLRFLNAAPVIPRVYQHLGLTAEVEIQPAEQ
jgi:vancomycin resistance protein VanJ